MKRLFAGIVGLVLALTAAGALAGCARAGRAPAFAGAAGKIKVAATFYPMYEFARAVGGDRADVVNLVPAGVEPHDWEPSPRDLETLNQAQVLVYNGAGMEHWIDKTLKSLDNKQLLAAETSRALDLDRTTGEDMHVWLDPVLAIKQVEAVRDALTRVDAAGKETFAANAAAYITGLHKLDQDYRQGLSGCKQSGFYTSHAAFGYLAKRYGITQHAIMGLAPDAEPRPQDLARLTQAARTEGIKYIFFETLVSDKVAKTIAREVGAQTLVLNPLEGLTDDDAKAGRNYMTIMQENLAHLRTAMECGK